MGRGRPVGTPRPTTVSGPPILHESPGRSDDWKPDYCDSCKVPRSAMKLLTFELRLDGKRAGEWTLCQPCYEWRQGRTPLGNPDPLQLEEAS